MILGDKNNNFLIDDVFFPKNIYKLKLVLIL